MTFPHGSEISAHHPGLFASVLRSSSGDLEISPNRRGRRAIPCSSSSHSGTVFCSIQDSAEELGFLLYFLHRDEFGDLSGFLEKYGVIGYFETLPGSQQLIQPFLLRRERSDVDSTIARKEERIIEVELTRIQKAYDQALLHENASTFLAQITAAALPWLLMQLRKVCNRPFLLTGTTDVIEGQMAYRLNKPVISDEVHYRVFVDSSGKLILVDKLLPLHRRDSPFLEPLIPPLRAPMAAFCAFSIIRRSSPYRASTTSPELPPVRSLHYTTEIGSETTVTAETE
jgi:hypothetical protein